MKIFSIVFALNILDDAIDAFDTKNDRSVRQMNRAQILYQFF